MNRFILLLSAAATLTACRKQEEPFRQGDANEAAAQTSAESTAMALTADTIEISTDFTIGEGVEKARENLRDFFASQVPCANVGLADGIVTVDYGAEGECEWRGRTYSGQHRVGIAKAEAGGIEVNHEWIALSNGQAMVDGTASVTWSLADKTRRVEHDLKWTVGRWTGEGAGDRLQTALGDGGLRIDGERSWTGPAGTWLLSVDGVRAYADDPVPEAGTYRLVTPKDHELTLTFLRLDEARIEVTLATSKREFRLVVRQPGAVEDSDA